jgi:hypothetical protein
MIRTLRQNFSKLGALRTMLVTIVLFLILIGPISGGEARTAGFALFTSVVAPAFYVIMLFVLPLDITMSRVFMGEAQGAERARYRFIIRLEIALFALMLLAWLPFILRLLGSAY